MMGLVHLQLASWWRYPRQAAVIVAAMLALAVVSSWATYGDIAQRDAHAEAAASARQQWEGRGAAHPHSMAHFGDFAFRPGGPLARLDRGVASARSNATTRTRHSETVGRMAHP